MDESQSLECVQRGFSFKARFCMVNMDFST
jgi:hypothetical protein